MKGIEHARLAVVKTASICSASKNRPSPDLVAQVRDNGIAHPIVIVPHPTNAGSFELYSGCGCKRLAAAVRLKWDEIQAIVLSDTLNRLSRASLGYFCRVVDRFVRGELSTYEVATLGQHFRNTHNLRTSDYARALGRSPNYIANLMRWAVTIESKKVLSAWQKSHPLINHTILEECSRLSSSDADALWEQRQKLQDRRAWRPGHPTPPDRPKRRRPSVARLSKLAAAIEDANLRNEPKKLCLDIVQFALGESDEVSGITDYAKLPRAVVKLKS
jgi:ParB/RepB/Spo0J family partition protein